MEIFEQDIAWLLEAVPDATENEQDAFAERISHLVLESSLDDQGAREFALSELIKNRKKLVYESA